MDIAAEVREWAPEVVRTGGMPVYCPKLPVLFVDDDAAFEVVCRELAQEPLVALDVETTLDTHALCLVQFATPERVVIVDPLALSALDSLRAVLENESVLKVIHNAPFERDVFARLGYDLVNVRDTLTESRRLNGHHAPGGHTLVAVCERELGFTLNKAEQTSRWARRPLTPEQFAYSVVDVEVLMLVVHALQGRSISPDSVGVPPSALGSSTKKDPQ